MLYIVEFLVAVAVICGALLYAVFLVSPLASLILAAVLAYTLYKNECGPGLAIIGSTYGLLTLVTLLMRAAPQLY